MAIFYRTSRLRVENITPKDNPHEIVAALCSLRGTSRKILCIGGYLTTGLSESEAEVYLEYMNDLLHSFKAKYRDPHIIVAGDWNRANTDVALEDFPAINAIPTPPHQWR